MKLAGAYIEESKYAALAALARRNHRTLADQCRCLYDRALEGDLVPQPPVKMPAKRRAKKSNKSE